MPTTLELIQQRESKIAAMQEAAKKADAARAKGESPAEYDAEFDRVEAEERLLSKQIAQQARLDQIAREKADKHLEQEEERGKKTGSGKPSEYREAFRQYFQYGMESLTAEQRELLNSSRANSSEQRAQSTTNTAGGYLIAPDYMAELERAIKDFSGIMQAARMVTTSTGVNIPWPTIDATSRKATIVAENAQSTPTDFTFAQKSLDSYTYRDMAAASIELVQDSEFDIDQFISESFAESFGRGLNYDMTLGNNTGQPNGVLTASTAGKTAASATAFTRAEIVDLVHSVNSGYRRSKKCGFMFSDTILAAIKKLSFGSGDDRPLWQISIREGEPDKLEGFQYWVNDDMPTALTTGQKIILFGDFNKYIVRRVRGMFIRRLEERFIDNGQIGYIAFARYDGELINTAAVKHLKLA